MSFFSHHSVPVDYTVRVFFPVYILLLWQMCSCSTKLEFYYPHQRQG